MICRPGDPFRPSSPIDLDEKSELPRTKVKSLVTDVRFLEKMELFCKEIEDDADRRLQEGSEKEEDSEKEHFNH